MGCMVSKFVFSNLINSFSHHSLNIYPQRDSCASGGVHEDTHGVSGQGVSWTC